MTAGPVTQVDLKDSIEVILQPHLERGLELWLEGDALRFKAPKELMTQDLVAVLKANKSDILAWLKAKAEAGESGNEPELLDEYPLAYTQGAIWMLYKFAPNSPAYNTTFACTLADGIDEAAVKQAFHALMLRHPVLRSTFTDTELGPRQQVWSHLPMPLQFVDGSQWDEQVLQQQLEQEADAPFDLHHESCLRVKLFRNTVKGDILIATIQHVGADLWALLIVAQDIKSFYEKASRGEALSVQPVSATYREHVEWQQSFLDSPRGKKERFYWQQQLTGAPLAISLPEDKPRPPVLQLQAKTTTHLVSNEQYQSIKQFCKQHSITPFVFVQTAFQLLVHQRTAAQDFLVGTPTMGRSRKGMDQVVGDFANPVVLRAKVQPDALLQTLFSTVKKTLLAAMEYQECPFPIVVQDCNPPRDSSRTPLFQLMFVWHQGNADMMPKDGFIKDVLPMSGPRGAPYDVMLAVSDLGDHFEMNWTYQTSLYDEATVDQFAGDVLKLMQACINTSTDVTVQQLLSQLELPVQAQLQSEEQQLQNQALEWEPRLSELSYQVLLDRTPQGELFKRIMVACSPETVQVLQPELSKHFQDILCLPELPYTASGTVDIWTLRQQTAIDQSYLTSLLEKEGGSSADLLIGRSRELLPTYSRDELAPVGHTSPSHQASAQVDLASRPDAWMKGEAFVAPSEQSSHLFAALQKTARNHPDKGFLFVSANGDETLYTYAQLERDAHVAAAGLQQSKLTAGDILLLQMRFDQRFFALWWGAILLGIRPLVVATPEHYHERNGVAQKLYNVAHNFAELTVAADRDRVEDSRRWLGESKQVIDADSVLEQGESIPTPAFNPDPVAFLQLTSGSTGTPKAIQITHQGVLHHVASSAQFNGYSNSDVSLNWLPFDHVVPILTTHLKDVVLGIQQVQLPTAAVLADPLLWLKALSRYRVNFSWAPNFAYQRILDALQLCQGTLALDLSCVRILMNAGEQVLAPVVQSFQAALEPYGLHPDAVQPAFGMAEACTCMTYNNHASTQLSVYFRPTNDLAVVDVIADQPRSQKAGGQGFVDLGPVIPGVEVRITDEHNQLVKEGVIGRMQIRGPVITPGYLNNPEANEEAFVGDGWFNSGDLGFIWNGHLILTGREKEMIVVNGANYYCFELEQAASKVAGVKPTFVAATGVSLTQGANSDELVLFYVAEPDVDRTALERQIIARVVESFSVVPRYVIEVEAEAFFKTTSGKIQRGQFKKLFEADHYRESVRDFDERHDAGQQFIDTVFAPLRKVRCIQKSRTDYTLVALNQLLEAGFDLRDRHPPGQKLLLDLGLCSIDQDQPEAGLLQLSQRLARIIPFLLQAKDYPNLSLWLQTNDPGALGLIKPLIETLRQETGLERLACVITAEGVTPEFPEAGAIVRHHAGIAESLQLVNVAQSSIPNEVIVRRGTYLITGGLGGLAEAVCDYLVGERKARVILSGRFPLTGDVRRQSRYNQLKARYGDQVHYVCLPDWDLVRLTAELKNALGVLGSATLEGIFHLAGHMAMAPLHEVSEDHWRAVMHAKGEGARALAGYLKQNWPRSILVQFGSVNGFFGGQAAAAYSAANAVQSRLTDQLNETTTIRSWCLNWSVWQGAGMARNFSNADVQMARNKGFMPLNLEQDKGLLARLLQLVPNNYFIGLDPSNSEIRKQVNPWQRSREIIDLLVDGSELAQTDRLRSQLQGLAAGVVPHAHTPQWNVRIASDPLARSENGTIRPDQIQQLQAQDEAQGEAPASSTEKALAAIWSDVLGRPVLDVTRTFFEYGGHSINATQVVSAINNKLGLPITVANLFQYPTIRELADLAMGETTDNTLSLVLADCIARDDEYRLDSLNPDVSSDTCLVFLPTALGLPSAYGQMAAALSRYKMLAVSLPKSDQAQASISTMASNIIRLLEKDGVLNGNVVLIGWSMAGVLGYEIMAQLSAANQPLPRLIMLDSGFADGLHEITFDESFQRLMFAVELGLTMDRYADFNQQPDDNTKLQWLKQYLQTIGIEVSGELLVEWWQAYHKRLKSLLTYKIEDELVDADIHLLKAALHSHGRTDLGWNDNNNRIKWTLIQADHQSVVKQPETFQRIQELLV